MEGIDIDRVHTLRIDDEERRASAWQAMLDQAGKYEDTKTPVSKWRTEKALRDLRHADVVQGTPFNFTHRPATAE